MNRKRFKHQVDIFCEMFSGWQLIGDITLLSKLGTGKIILDFMNCTVLYNDKIFHEELTLLRVISGWLKADLSKHNIDLSKILEAQLEIKFDIRPSAEIDKRNKKSLSVEMELRGQITTSTKTYFKEKFYNVIYSLR